MALADLNGDGLLDVIALNEFSATASLFLNAGGGALALPTTWPTGPQPIGAAVGDLNGDSRPDLVLSNYSGNTFSVLLTSPDAGFLAPMAFSTGLGPISVALGDLDRDGRLDVAVANWLADSVSVFGGLDGGQFAPRSTVPVMGSHPYCVVLSDLDGDGLADVTTANGVSANVSVMINQSSWTFQPARLVPTGLTSNWVAAGDLDDDGLLDLAVANAGTGQAMASLSVLRNTDAGHFSVSGTYQTGQYLRTVRIGDVNGDRLPDLVVANHADGTIGLFANADGGVFGSQQLIGPVIAGAVHLELGDLDGDGRLDVVVGTYSPNVSGGEITVLLQRCGP
ncbi:MAG: VCBS repeat-containing protein [Myxococcaceae bacterium]|nr:VCBS repeat-containing protein [Myxococcaceae bacterium]